MQTARPVDHNVGQSLVKATGTSNRPGTVGADVIKETVEDGTILADIDYPS